MRRIAGIVIFVFILQLFFPVFADDLRIGTDIGDVLATDIVAQINGNAIPSYNIDNSTAVKASDLKYYGFDVEWDDENRSVYIKRNEGKAVIPIFFEEAVNTNIGSKLGDVLFTDIKTFIEDRQVQSFNMNGSTLIYFKELKEYGSLSWNGENRVASLVLNESTRIEIPDFALENAVREQLGKLDGNITASDAATITFLSVDGEEIESLEGLQYFKNLTTLYISYGKITDLSPIEGLSSIKSLYIDSNSIENISPLRNMTTLTGLYLRSNNIKDISVLENLTNLESLYLSQNNIENIEALSKLTKLRYLDLSGNQIKDIEALGNITGLVSLSLNDCNIENVQSLEGLTKLYTLYLDDNMIKDISVIEKLTELNYLYLNDNPIEDLSPVKKLKKLQGFAAFHCSELDKAETVLKKAKEVIAAVIKPGMSDYEKELALHDYIVNNTRYDYQNYLDNTIPNDSYWPYGILVNKAGVCNAYAYTMKLLLSMVDIECMIITGTGNGGGHAWNLVKLDNEYYHLDATWDDPINWYYDGKDIISYNYFNITDAQMSRDHNWDKTQYPKCDSVAYNYRFMEYWIKNNIEIGTISYITGRIKLKEGDVAPEGGMDIQLTVSTQSSKDSYEYFYIYEKLTMPEGANFIEYKIPVIPNTYGYNMSYWIYGLKPEGYFYDGNVYEYGVSKSYNESSKIMVGDEDKVLDIELAKGWDLKGTVSLSDSINLGDNEGLYIYIYAESDIDGHYMHQSVYLSKYETSMDYSITVLNTPSNYKLRIEIFSDDGNGKTVFYKAGGTTNNASLADVISINSDCTEVNIMITE